MKRRNLLLLTLVVVLGGGSLFCFADKQESGKKKKILFYSQSMGFRHGPVTRPLSGKMSHAERIFKEIATKAGYDVYVSQDFNDLKQNQFKSYDAIVFYTSGDLLINKENFMKWLRGGGAFIGIHSATDTYKGWPEYIKAIGGRFRGHGRQQKATMKVEVTDHPATKMLDKDWTLLDEIYLFDSYSRDNVNVLISIDTEKTSEDKLKNMNMKPGKDYPIAWTNTEGNGRIFYTSLGHREDVWTNPKYQEHLLGGIAWALKLEGDK